jgi:choline dehydrogenase-like flavoprotein
MKWFTDVIESSLKEVAAHSKKIDYLIIGSGTAGVTTAIELATAGKSVVIIEAGPFVMMEHIGSSPLRLRSEFIQQLSNHVKYGISWLTEKEFEASLPDYSPNNSAWANAGGRTLFWCGLAPRFNPEEFIDWPFSYQEFKPFYERAEEIIGVSNNFYHSPAQQQFINYLNKAGIHAVNAPVAVDTNALSQCRISNSFDSSISRLISSGLLKSFTPNPGISLLTETSATRLVAKNNKIECVTVLDKRLGETHHLAAKQVVLAGGAVQSTRLALASALDNGLIGHYVTDHLCIRGVIKLKNPPKTAPLFIVIPPTLQCPYQFQLHGPFGDAEQRVLRFPTFWLDWQKDGAYLIFVALGVSAIEKQNRVVLWNKKVNDNELNNFAVVHHYTQHDLTLLKAMENMSHTIANSLEGEVISSEIANPGNPLHEYGGLRMGTDPTTSITDPYGRFWNYRNLSAADASIWPSQGAANSYLSITATSLWHAQGLLKREHQEKL